MLPAANRLRNAKDFKRVYARGRSYVRPLLVLYLRHTCDDSIRFGFSISKKLGRATVRNRIKRRLRELCRARLGQLTPGFDAVVVGRPSLARAESDEVAEALDATLRMAGAIGRQEDSSCGDSASR